MRYWELFPASYWALSIFFYLLHVKPTTRSRGINGAHVSPKVGHHHLYPNCCLQILQEIHKKCKACLESKEHLQLEEYFLACGINKCCTVLKVREGWMCDIRVWRVKCEVTWVRDPTMYITRSKFMLMIFKYFHEKSPEEIMASAFCEQWGVKSDWNLKRIHPLPASPPLGHYHALGQIKSCQ